MLSNYKVIKSLGRGAFGETFQVQNITDGKFYAMKKYIRASTQALDIVKRERERENEEKILRAVFAICQPAAPCFKEAFFEGGLHYIVMDFINGWSLKQATIGFDRMPLAERQVRFDHIIEDLSMGLALIHSLGIVHQDIKDENIMYDSQLNRFKYIDFGLSCMLDKSDENVLYSPIFKNHPCGVPGTPLFLSPEMIDQQGYPIKDGVFLKSWLLAHDIWSLGCILFTWFGYPDSYDEDTDFFYYGYEFSRKPNAYKEMFANIKKHSSKVYNFVILCFQRDPLTRLNYFEQFSESPSDLDIKSNWSNAQYTMNAFLLNRNINDSNMERIEKEEAAYKEYMINKARKILNDRKLNATIPAADIVTQVEPAVYAPPASQPTTYVPPTNQPTFSFFSNLPVMKNK